MDVRVVRAQGIGPRCSPDVHVVVDSVTIWFLSCLFILCDVATLPRSIVKGLKWVVEL